MEEEWIKWEPVLGLARIYKLKSVFEHKEKLIIDVVDFLNESIELKIIFKNVIAYRRFFKALVSREEMNEHYPEDKLYQFWAFYKVKNSDFLELISDDNYKVANRLIVQHFVFEVIHNFVEVLAIEEPTFEFINVPKE